MAKWSNIRTIMFSIRKQTSFKSVSSRSNIIDGCKQRTQKMMMDWRLLNADEPICVSLFNDCSFSSVANIFAERRLSPK